MIISYDNQIINLDMGWRAIHLDANFGNVDWSVNTPTYTITIELNDKSSCTLGIFSSDEHWLAQIMLDEIKKGLANNTAFLDLDDYMKMWKKKAEKEKENV